MSAADDAPHPVAMAAWAAIAGFKATYSAWYPAKHPDALFHEHVQYMLADDTCTSDQMLHAFGEAQEFTAERLLLIGVAFACKAVQLCSVGKPDAAWPLALEAAYINGLMRGSSPARQAEPADATRYALMTAADAGRRGGLAAQAEDRGMKADVRGWCEEPGRLAQFASLNKLRDAVVQARLNAASAKTVRGWLTEFAKEWRAAGLWVH